MRSKTRVLLLSILAVTASSLAMADALVNVKSEVVRYDDIRLISTVGAAVLYGRLHGAAVRACGGPVESLQLAQQKRYRACMDDTLSKAVADVNSPVLGKYFESRRGAPVPGGISAPSSAAVAKAR